MKIFVQPIGMHSRAMSRIANAFRDHLPMGWIETWDCYTADVIVVYAIGKDHLKIAEDYMFAGKEVIIIQCCLATTGATATEWSNIWNNNNCICVYSYIDILRALVVENVDFTVIDSIKNKFIFGPLGIDEVFLSQPQISVSKKLEKPTIVTTGYVSAPGAEAIIDVWKAAAMYRELPMRFKRVTNYLDIRVIHVGGSEDLLREAKENFSGTVEIKLNISDKELASIYASALFVFSLRYVEGFELPALEALACGTLPVLFYQRDLHRHYNNAALYITERSNCVDMDVLTLLQRKDFDLSSTAKSVMDSCNWKTIIYNIITVADRSL